MRYAIKKDLHRCFESKLDNAVSLSFQKDLNDNEIIGIITDVSQAELLAKILKRDHEKDVSSALKAGKKEILENAKQNYNGVIDLSQLQIFRTL